MTPVLLAALLAAALGADLGLTLLVLGGLAHLGGLPTELEVLGGLGTPWVLGAAGLIWAAEHLVEQLAVTPMALWHAMQAVARPLTALLLVGALVGGAGGGPASSAAGWLLAGAAALVTGSVHTGGVGWQAFLQLGRVPPRTRWIASLAEDTAVVALLALGLDHPGTAVALLAVLTLAAPRHHLTSLAGARLLIRGLTGDARRLLRPGGWRTGSAIPSWARRESGAGPLELRGSPGGLQGPEASRLRYGWIVVAPSGRAFVPRFGRRVKLESTLESPVREERLATRVALASGLVLLLPPDGPGAPELEVEFGSGPVTEGSHSL